jgi:hypothetical protein
MRALLLLLALVTIEGAAAADQPAPRAKEASRAFSEGSQLFEKGDYVGAALAFERAHRLRPHFSVLCNIALCHERLGNMIKAGSFFRRCLAEGAAKTTEAEAIRNSIKRVEERVAWAEVSSPGAGGTVYVDGEPIGQAPRRLPLNPGSHVLEVRRANAEPVRATLLVRGGEQRRLELVPLATAAPPTQPSPRQPVGRRRLSPIWFWSSAGLAAAFGIAATVLGVQTLSIRSDYEANPSQVLLDRGRARRLATNLCWAGAAASAGSAAALFFFTDFRRDRSTGGERTSLVLGLQGSF